MLGPVVAALALAAPPIQRWYEVDLRAAADGGAPTTGSGLALAELVHELAAQRFDGVLLWLPPPLAADLPPEPHAREFPRAALPPPIAALLGPDLEPSLRVALGAPAPDEADDARRHGSASFHALWIEGPGAPLELARAVRPEVTTLLWCDPEWDLDSDALALSERLVFEATPALRPLQARLDVAAFGGAGLDGARAAAQRAGIEGAAFERLRLQSRLASRIARRLSGATPERCDPLQNTWSGPPPPDLPGALRRAPPWIDLEETRLSPGAFARGESGGGERDTAEFESVASAAAAASGSECAGVLAAGDVAALAQLAAARRAAAFHLGRWLLLADAGELAQVQAGLARAVAAAAKIDAPELAQTWKSGLADDRSRVDALEPWRVHAFHWQLAFADRPGAPIDVTVHQVDDERALGFGDLVADDSVGEQLPLSRLVALDPARPLLLRTELPLVDPRAARLEISGGGRFTLRVNGVELVSRFDATRQRLTTTLPLAAGRNRVELELAPLPGGGDPTLRCTVLPHRIEGITLEPKRALRTAEPVVRLRDPAALSEECLVWPEGRNVGGKTSGNAELPFEPLWPGRSDVWVHVLFASAAPRGASEGGAQLDVALDEGVAQALTIAADPKWQWLRLPAPIPATSGAHRLVLTFRTPGLRVDAVTCFETGLGFPHRPAGDGSLFDAAWRFDPLGTGIVIEIPPLASGDPYGPTFKVDKSGSYQVYVWLRGRDPLQPGESAEVDLTSPTSRVRFVVPYGTPYEEWTAVGSVNLTSDERIEMRSRGRGSLTRVTFLR
jgi:hypothetical protein